MKKGNCILKTLILVFPLMFLFACKDEDDNSSIINDFLGSYDADISVNNSGGTFAEQYILFIETPASGAEDEISIRNIADEGNTYTAKVIGRDFIINQNPDYVTGTGTLQSGNQTIQLDYEIESQESGTGTLTKR